MIGQNIPRVDAFEKVTGGAKYTDDLRIGVSGTMLVAKVIHSTIANGMVTSFDLEKALALPGVVKILTCFDAPEHSFPTAGHPWSTEASHQDICDRRLLNARVRYYGDDIGVVIAKDEITAAQAAALVEVEYDEYPHFLTVQDAMYDDATPLHPDLRRDNVLAHSTYRIGTEDEQVIEAAFEDSSYQVLEERFTLSPVQHCHIESALSYAYMEKDRIVVVASTQIPHILRRIIGQALGIPWGKVRVIKPYIGGGFGNKQDALYEPLNAWLTTQVGGRAVKLELSREEVMSCTRVRHGMDIYLQTAVDEQGRFAARRVLAYANNGAYASHGHAVVANTITEMRMNYSQTVGMEGEAYTVYTNLPTAGAMRAYGIPQSVFALESHIDDIAKRLGMDPIALRRKNCNYMQAGFEDSILHFRCYTTAMPQILDYGQKAFDWDNKRAAYAAQTGTVRKGLGMALFSYKTGVYPISLETASCRMVLHQDGSVQLQMGATEIGQGADTVFTQMAADTLGLVVEDVHIVSVQDTDVTPFDTAAYASRQTYVCGMAVKQTAQSLRQKILEYAAKMYAADPAALTIADSKIMVADTGAVCGTVGDVALTALYSLTDSVHLTAEETHQCKDNTIAMGACFVEVEVDIPLGKVKVLRVLNIHDSGTLIHPKLAEAQVHGGMSMSLGYALGEGLLFDKSGRMLNNNLLDYKLPTAMDTPELEVKFFESADPSAPYGNKALGEPPAIPVAPAIRNAILNATGVPIYKLPMNAQSLVEAFTEAGLIKMGGADHV